jgi:hypothetical protein
VLKPPDEYGFMVDNACFLQAASQRKNSEAYDELGALEYSAPDRHEE